MNEPSRRRAPFFVLLASLLLPRFGGAAEVELRLVTAFDFSPGNAANDDSFVRAASPDGRFLVIDSESNNLDGGDPIDTNSTMDVFVLDRQDGLFDLVSRRAGLPARSAEGTSHGVAISDDGRFVLFESSARDLIAGVAFPGDSGTRQILLFDRATRATQLVSRSRASAQVAGDGSSRAAALSPDGRWALFSSSAANLGGGTEEEVYLYDRETGAHQLVSRSAGPPHTSGNDDSTAVDLSADGRHVLFSSEATNLVAGQIDGQNSSDVFLFDRDSGAIELISRGPANPLQAVGGSAADITPDGRFLLLSSPGVALVAGLADGNGSRPDLFLRDRQSGQTRLASPSATVAGHSADGGSQAYRVSDDGRFVYFSSSAGDLVSPFTDGNGAESDVYLFDAAGGSVTLVSHVAGAPSVGADAKVGLRAVRQNSSADGRYALLETMASNLDPDADDPAGFDLYLYDRTRGQSTLASRYGGTARSGSAPIIDSDLLAGDGEVFFASAGPLDQHAKDPHQQVDVFRFSGGTAVELVTATPLLGRTPAPYGPGAARFGHHPRWAVWGPYLYDILTGKREIVAFPAGQPTVAALGYGTSISADGRFVLHGSDATDLVTGLSDANEGTDLFIYDRTAAAATLLTHAAGSPLVAANGSSQAALLSVDGRFVAFESSASDLVAGQSPTGGAEVNVYLHDRASGLASLISHAAGSPLAAADRSSRVTAFDPQGAWLILGSNARDLVPGFVDRNGERQDVYFYDRAAGQARLITRRAGTLAEGSARTISAYPVMAVADGSSVFYTSDADDLAVGQIPLPGEDKIFRWDRASGKSHLESYPGEEPERPCSGSVRFADVTADGRFLLLDGTCQLVPGDANALSDVYLLDRATRSFILISHPPNQPGASLGTYSRAYEVTDDGRRILYRQGDVPYSYDRAKGEATPLARAYYEPREAGYMTPDFLSSSAGGTRVLFGTFDARLAPFDANTSLDTYLALLAEVFADGFESGNTAAWSAAVP